MYPFFHNYKMALEVVTSVHLVKKKTKNIQAEISLSYLVHPHMQRYVNEMKLLEIIRIGFLPGKMVTACLQLMVCSSLLEKIDLFYNRNISWHAPKLSVCACVMVVTAVLGKQKQKELWGPASLAAAWLLWLNEFAWCVFLLWRHQCIMGCYQNSLLLSINLLISNLLKDCVCVCVCVCARARARAYACAQ